MAKKKLAQKMVDGKIYWFSQGIKPAPMDLSAYLLSIYDECVIGYKDRSALGEERLKRLILMGNAMTAAMVLKGKIVGTWKGQIRKSLTEIKLNPFIKLSTGEKQAFERAAARYGQFAESPIVLTF